MCKFFTSLYMIFFIRLEFIVMHKFRNWLPKNGRRFICNTMISKHDMGFHGSMIYVRLFMRLS